MGCDVYCALCGGPTVYVRIDDKSRKAKLREKREEALRAGMDVDSVQEEKISYDCGYDPEVVSRADVEWARWSVVLGFNPESTHVQKMFLSSSGTYEDYGFITGLGNCDDPNFPEDCTELQCYDTYDANQPPSFPMHKPCLQLFRKNILLKTGTDFIDKDLLYHIMLDLYKHGGRCGLPLDYGEVAQEHDQYWQSLPGEELMAINTTPMPPALEPLLRDTISAAATTTPTAPPAPLSLDAKVLRDPFAALPYDLHHEILTHLGPDPAAVLALRTASWPVHAAVRAAPAFWRRALHASMPWFGELHAAAEERTEDVDWQTLFRRAEAQTRPVRGVEGAWMGVANRRRVWGACEQLAAVYVPRLIAQEREERREGGDGRDAEARAIWEGAENLMMPVVVSPMPERGVQTAWRQWVRSFEEVGAQDVGFETVWDGEGSLVGVGVTVSGSRRLFGKDVEGEGMKKGAVTIEKGHWITGLVLHLPDMCLANHPPGRLRNTIKWKEEKLSASIKGVTVITTAGNQKLGDTNPEYNQRLLPVSEGKTLVGVVGHISGTGAIARIGLVQAARPLPNSPPPPADEDDDDEEEEETPRYPLLHRMLWKPTPLPPAWGNAIWAHPSLRALPYTTDALNRYQIQASIHEDLVPAEPLIWGATRDELRALRRVECYQREDGRDICGFRVVLEGQVEGRVVGNARAVGEKGDEVDEKKVGGEWPVRDVVGLGVDGAGGEVVVAVEVMRDEAIKAVKLRTNRGREVYWGERNINNRPFDSMVAPEGETIVGIAVGFGYQGGFSWANERYSYSTMSWIAALTMPL